MSVKQRNRILIGAMVFACVIAAAIFGGSFLTSSTFDIADECALVGGGWNAAAQECEFMQTSPSASSEDHLHMGAEPREWCQAMRGAYNPCASACRHKPSEICVSVCAPVCVFSAQRK